MGAWCAHLGQTAPQMSEISLEIGEIELIYARSAFKMFSNHKLMPGAFHERSLPRGSLALLAKLKELGDASKSDLVRACGYVSTKKNGADRLNFTAFHEAVLSAKGVSTLAATATTKPGRKLSYSTTVQGNGNLLVGKAYTSLFGFNPGDEFEIKISRRQIRLIPVGAAQGTESSDED